MTIPPKNVIPPKKSIKNLKFQCQQCGRCCFNKNTIVNLTYSDILRIVWTFQYDLNDLLKYIGFYKFEGELTHDKLKKMIIPPIQTQNGLAFMGLRKKNDGHCIFLKKNNKCKIYTSRPVICRTFPFHFFYKNNEIVIEYASKALEYCPGIKGSQPPINEIVWKKEGEIALNEINKEIKLVKKWNDNVEKGKISPSAENYLRIILNRVKKENNQKFSRENLGKNIEKKKNTKKKISYKERIRKKLSKSNS